MLTFRSSNNEERLGKEDGSSWFSSKMVSKDSQEEGQEICVIKALLSTKKERHARRERVAGREERKSWFFLSFSWFERLRKEGNNTRELLLELGEVWAPSSHVVQGFKTPSCGSRMRSTKEGKMLVKMSSLQKV